MAKANQDEVNDMFRSLNLAGDESFLLIGDKRIVCYLESGGYVVPGSLENGKVDDFGQPRLHLDIYDNSLGNKSIRVKPIVDEHERDLVRAKLGLDCSFW